jgi:hypothetical protein
MKSIKAANLSHSRKVKREALVARRALIDLLRKGPMVVSTATIAQARKMSDAEVLSLKYEMRDFLNAIAAGNGRVQRVASGRVNSRESLASGIVIRRPR